MLLRRYKERAAAVKAPAAAPTVKKPAEAPKSKAGKSKREKK